MGRRRKPTHRPEPDFSLEEFCAVLDFVNPILVRMSGYLDDAISSRALNLAEMDVVAARIDRTQAETRAIIADLYSFGRAKQP